MEAFWEDSFTGIAYCRARWLLRASEIPREDVSEDEVLLTTVTDNIEAAHILRLAPVVVASSPGTEAKREPEAKPEPSAGTRQGLRPKPRSPRLGKLMRGKRAREEDATTTLRLTRAYDPFSAEASVLPTDHPVVVQLRARERAGGSGRLKAGGCLSDAHGCPRKGGCGRAGAQRKGLDGARLVVAAPPTRAFGARRSGGVTTTTTSGGGSGGFSSSTSSVSVSVGGDSESSNGSSEGGFTSEDSQDDLLDVDDDDDMVSAGYPRTRRGRRRQATAAAASGEALTKAGEPTAATKPGAPETASDTSSSDRTAKRPARPRRLAMPPADSATGLGGEGGARVAEAGGRKCQQQLRGGFLIRAAHAGEEPEDGLDSPKLEQYPQKETNVGEDHQADIPSMLLTEAERAVDKAAMEETAEMGGTAVSFVPFFCLFFFASAPTK